MAIVSGILPLSVSSASRRFIFSPETIAAILGGPSLEALTFRTVSQQADGDVLCQIILASPNLRHREVSDSYKFSPKLKHRDMFVAE
jgi:hypothetical protein